MNEIASPIGIVLQEASLMIAANGVSGPKMRNHELQINSEHYAEKLICL